MARAESSKLQRLRRIELSILSFAPLFCLMMVKKWNCALFNDLCSWICYKQHSVPVMDEGRIVTLIIFAISIIWLIISIIVLIQFFDFSRASGADRDDHIRIVADTTDAGFVFFLSYVVPLMAHIDSYHGLILFGLLFLMVIVLMIKTNLYYQNPVLTILGYRSCEYQYVGDQFGDIYIGIYHGKLETSKAVIYKTISGSVRLIRNRR
jgi:hypothetical protein